MAVTQNLHQTLDRIFKAENKVSALVVTVLRKDMQQILEMLQSYNPVIEEKSHDLVKIRFYSYYDPDAFVRRFALAGIPCDLEYPVLNSSYTGTFHARFNKQGQLYFPVAADAAILSEEDGVAAAKYLLNIALNN